MKGIGKALARTPHMLGSKVGMAKKSTDAEFEELNRRFTAIEGALEKFLKDCTTYNDSVISVLMGSENWATRFNTIFSPIASEYDLIGKHPEAVDTIRNIGEYADSMADLHATLKPELELVQSRVVNPAKELQGIMKQLRKNITKREHKLVDYDRHNAELTKLRDKKEKSLKDEQNLYKVEQSFENASADYDHWNTLMKTELPTFLMLCTRFIDPLFHSFYYMQLNIFYTTMEKVQSYAEGKYDVTATPSEVQQAYEEQAGQTGARGVYEDMVITKRMVSTARMVQTKRASEGGGIGGSTSGGSSISRAPTSSYAKKPPPPPPGSTSSFQKQPPPAAPSAAAVAAPPPYSAPATGAKRPPPPIPPNRPKPSATYVVALYDFVAQAEGDLSFQTGDRIEIVKRSLNAEDWWTGRLNGQEGVFPGNYVQET